METALENRNVLGGSAAELCKLIDGPATGPQPQSTHNAFVRVCESVAYAILHDWRYCIGCNSYAVTLICRNMH